MSKSKALTDLRRRIAAQADYGTRIIGLTPIGRATVEALQLNHDLVVHARRQWVKVGWHPPEEDNL